MNAAQPVSSAGASGAGCAGICTASGASATRSAAGAETTEDLVRDGGPAQGDGNDVLLGVLEALADGFGNLVGLAHAEADAALAVAHYAQSGELRNTAALDGLADAVEGYDLLNKFGGSLFLIAAVTSVIVVSHDISPFLRTSGRPRGRLRPEP